MVKKFDIPEELQDSSWTGNAPDVVSPPGLKFANLNLVENWTVKLEFHVNGALTTGSGFFVNFPDCAYDVVLTAAHNLISPAGTLSSDLTVLLAVGTRVPATNFHVSAAYKVQQTPVDDYGAILLPRAPSGVPRDGYPFSMRLAFEDAFKGSIYVSGYRADTQPGQPKTSSGACVGCYAEQLEYKAGTEQGISGSPVWIEYHGLQTAVAIQCALTPLLRRRSRFAKLTLRARAQQPPPGEGPGREPRVAPQPEAAARGVRVGVCGRVRCRAQRAGQHRDACAAPRARALPFLP